MDAQQLATQFTTELSLQYRTVWDLYIKFYTAFLIFNITALGISAEKLTSQRAKLFLMWSFIMQNVFCAITAVGIGLYSLKVGNDCEAVYGALASGITNGPAATHLLPILSKSPIAGSLGGQSAFFNALSHVFFIVFWVGVTYHQRRPTTSRSLPATRESPECEG